MVLGWTGLELARAGLRYKENGNKPVANISQRRNLQVQTQVLCGYKRAAK